MWEVKFTPIALEDLEKLKAIGLSDRVEAFKNILEQNPYSPPCEKLIGDYKGCYSRRINIKHRLVYRVFKQTKTVLIIRLWSHYDD